MILGKQAILDAIDRGDIVIDPFDINRLNPNSYNLRLHDELVVYDEVVLDMAKDNRNSKIYIPTEGLILQPGKLYLGCTVEHTETNNFVPRLDGRSSIGRLGICIHITAAYGDAGYKGAWTLELTAVQPVRVYAGVEVCQISYEQVDRPGEYSGKYQNAARTPVPSRLYKDFQGKS